MFTARLPALQLLALMLTTSAVLVWFGWWRHDEYAGVPEGAVFLDQRRDGSWVTASNGTVTWSLAKDDGKGSGVAAHLLFPDRGLRLALSLRKNSDKTLPASHLIEIVQEPPANSANEQEVEDISIPQVLDERNGASKPLIGVAAKIGDRSFWIALSPVPQDVVANLGLLRRARSIGLPLTYGSGQHGLLVFNEGPQGKLLLRSAMLEWAR